MANQDVMQALEVKQLTVSNGGTFTRLEQVHRYPAANGKAGATSTVGYVNTGTDLPMVTLAQNATADTWVIPITGLHVGDKITKIGISGQIESGGNAVTVDYALRAQTPVATGSTDATLQAGTQISKTGDYLINEYTTVSSPHTISNDKIVYMLITCTTGATTDIELLNVAVITTSS